MSINLTIPEEIKVEQNLKPRLIVIGVGGAGGNAVNNMIKAELKGVDFVVANTDAQALSLSSTERRLQLGRQITQGLGAGSRPEIGRAAAEEAIDDIIAELNGAHMVFIAAGMGGGTGTGGAPVIARASKENGILTVGVVTKPFQFEGTHRMTQAESGIEDLEQYVDTLIVIPNQNLFRIANEKTTFADAFAMADEVLYSGVRGVTDLMVMPGLINLDFADIRSVMGEMGKAMMGTGEADGERRALDAAEAAIANPLLDDMSMKGARGVLINITGGMDITLFEVDEAANRIRAEVDQDAYIIVGSAFDESLDGIMRVSVVATGIDADAQQAPLPTMLHLAEQLDDPVGGEEAEVESAYEAPPQYETAAEDEAEAETHLPEQPAAGELPVETPHGTPMAAIPAIGATDAFIPPEPACAGGDEDGDDVPGDDGGGEEAPDEAPEEAPATDPAASYKSKIRSRGISLFERVTGGSRAAFGKKEPAPVLAPVSASSIAEDPEVTGNKELSVTDGVVETAPEAPPEAHVESFGEAAEADGKTPEPGADSTEDRVVSGKSEEDLLDIPAFLRRQAN